MSLPELTPHPHNQLIKQLGVARVAKAIGITTSYLYGILSGVYEPSRPLQMDIDKVMTDILAETTEEEVRECLN
jgi:hypothetical protein